MKKSVLYNMIYGNRAVSICVFFTIATILDLILCVSEGITDISYSHLGDRFILCVVASLSLMIFRRFEQFSLLVILLIHFFICILMMLLYVWTGSFYMEVHHDAYRDAVRTVFYIYPAIIIGGLIIDGYRTAKANRILKKSHLT